MVDSKEAKEGKVLNLEDALDSGLLARKLFARQIQDSQAKKEIFGVSESTGVHSVTVEVPQAIVELESPPPGTHNPLETGRVEPVPQLGVSDELRGLFVQYCASMIQAYELKDVAWAALAQRLGTRAEHLQQAAEVTDRDGTLWRDVMSERIRRVGAARTFRDVKWETLESKSLNMLTLLLEKNLIRDPGELMAIAAQARKVNVHESGGFGQPGNNFTINIGADSLGQDGLPAAGAKMTIDLSPRIATSLANRIQPTDKDNRVIDSDMLDAKELRTILEERNARKSNPEGETNE